MTCDIFGTGETDILALCYLFGKLINQITGRVIDMSLTHIPLKALVIPLKRVELRGVV